MTDPSPTFDSFWKDCAPGADAALRLRHARTLAAAVVQQRSVSMHVWEDATVLENGDLNLPAGLSRPMEADQFAKSATEKLRHLLDGLEHPWASASRPLLESAPIDWQNLLRALERNYQPPDISDEENGGHPSESRPRHWPLILVTATCLGVSAWLFLANLSSDPPASISAQAAATPTPPLPAPKPQPAPVTKSEPKLPPPPQPAPKVVAVTKPEPTPAPQPATVTKPEAAPKPAPQPAPMVAAAPKPEPAPEPKAAPTPVPVTKPEPKPAPQPAPMVAAAPKPEPAPEPKAAAAPVTKPEAAQPATKPAPMRVALAKPEPAPVPKAVPVGNPKPSPTPAPAPAEEVHLAGVWHSKGPHAKLTVNGGSLSFHQIAAKSFAITMSSLELDEVGPALAIPPVFLSETEVTYAQWRLIDPTPRDLGDDSNPDAAVTNVTWQEADEWCKKLQQALPRDAPLIVRLPWQFEWEFAARQEYTELKHEFEDNWTAKALALDKSTGHLPAAHDAAPSSLGLRGLLGNVSEWMGDAESGSGRAQPALGHSKDQGAHQHIFRGNAILNSTPSFVERTLYLSTPISDSSRSPLRGFRVALQTR